MYRTIGVIAMLVMASVAHAAEGLKSQMSCSVWTLAANRMLFLNSGAFATKGFTLAAIPECVHTGTGFYGNLFLIGPIEDFATGKEVDIRGGRRFNAGGVDVDVSVADYAFSIGHGANSVYNTGNARLRLSHMFDLGRGTTIQPYVIGDYQHSFTLHADAYAVAAGVVINTKLDSLPGKPMLGVEASDWYYPKTFAPGKGPIERLDLSLGFPVGKATVGPLVRRTWGNVVDPKDHQPKNMFGVTLFYPF
jgi:hypothetical protein